MITGLDSGCGPTLLATVWLSAGELSSERSVICTAGDELLCEEAGTITGFCEQETTRTEQSTETIT